MNPSYLFFEITCDYSYSEKLWLCLITCELLMLKFILCELLLWSVWTPLKLLFWGEEFLLKSANFFKELDSEDVLNTDLSHFESLPFFGSLSWILDF